MTTASLSNETLIRRRLEQLHCAENSFVVFNGIVGKTRFSEAMTGKPGKHFNDYDARRLLDVIEEMESLQTEVGVPIDWSRTDQITIALTMRRIVKIESELRLEPNPHFRNAEKIATNSVKA